MTPDEEAKAEPEPEVHQRSLPLDVFVADEQRQPVLNAIRRYRAGCRQMFSVLGLAQAAGAELQQREDGSVHLRPKNDRAKIVLAAAMGSAKIDKDKGERARGDGLLYSVSVGKTSVYELREYFLKELYPDALSFVSDSARRLVWERWVAKDQEFPKANRGWLVLQGARELGKFQYIGIACPQATSRPSLDKKSVTVKWDKELGSVQFSLGRLDPGRWHTWKKIVSGEWAPGTVTVTERDGQIRLIVTYGRPSEPATVDSDRVLTVTLDSKQMVLAHGDELDTIGLEDAIGQLARYRQQNQLWSDRKGCAGSPRRPWGDKKAWRATVEHLGRVTVARSGFASDRNHAWTRRIATRAKYWRCGVVQWKSPAESMLGDESWPWADFTAKLKYKLALNGVTLATA